MRPDDSLARKSLPLLGRSQNTAVATADFLADLTLWIMSDRVWQDRAAQRENLNEKRTLMKDLDIEDKG